MTVTTELVAIILAFIGSTIVSVFGFIVAMKQIKVSQDANAAMKTQLGVVQEATDGNLSRLQTTVEGLKDQLVSVGMVPMPTVLKGATQAPADNTTIKSVGTS